MQQAGGFDLTHVGFEGKARPAGAQFRPRGRSRVRTPTPLRNRLADDPLVDAFPRQVLEASGINPDLYRNAPLRRRVAACLRALEVTSEQEAAEVLAARPELLPVAVNALLIGVTEFYRDPVVFENLRTMVVPALAHPGRRIRIWSAACSSGAEAYSVAMLLAEADLLERSEILGTDCRPGALSEAEDAVYPASVLVSLPEMLRQRYFVQAPGGWRVIEPLRAAIRWKLSDLSAGVEDGPWDLILCRNATIYLNPEPALRLASWLADALAIGGCLVVGKAERAPDGGPLAQIARCIYRKGVHRGPDLG